jgi:hypothetical protein
MGLAVIVGITMILYIALTGLTLRAVWSSRSLLAPVAIGPWSRIPIRAAVAAFLFSPTLAFSGVIAPLPFPMIIALDLFDPSFHSTRQLAWNATYVVTPTWLIVMMAQVLYKLSKRHAR